MLLIQKQRPGRRPFLFYRQRCDFELNPLFIVAMESVRNSRGRRADLLNYLLSVAIRYLTMQKISCTAIS